MGFSSNGVNNWKLIDLNITTNAASGTTSSGRGKSNYAVWINSSTGYQIIRCNITAGAGTDGAGGGNGGAGHNGVNGIQATGASCGDGGRWGGLWWRCGKRFLRW
jgi:hypothetical protein